MTLYAVALHRCMHGKRGYLVNQQLDQSIILIVLDESPPSSRNQAFALFRLTRLIRSSLVYSDALPDSVFEYDKYRLIRIRISGDAIPNSTHESSQLIDRSIPLTLSQNDGTATDGSGRLSIIAILMSSILS